ncbi:MAG: ABC transporter ATP-binding protein [Sphingomonadales bacterium]
MIAKSETDMQGLELDHIRFSIGGAMVVDDVSLAVEPGRIVCLLGPSGCGKTTSLRIAAGLERPLSGEVRIGGRVVASPDQFMPPEARKVGLVLQDYALFPHLTAAENVTFGLTGASRHEARSRALRLLDMVGLARHADAYPHTMSGGEQQRVALARALAPEPAVMLLDEPFSGLDASLRNKVREQATQVLKELAVPTLLVTHDPEEAMRIADKVAVMKAGRIIQTGSPWQIYSQPESEWVARLFGEPNRFEGSVAGGFVATPLGPIAADGFDDGAMVNVLVRPRALELGAADGVCAQVIRARPIGADILVDLVVGEMNLHAHIPHTTLIQVGAEVHLSVDRNQIHVFPRVGGRD